MRGKGKKPKAIKKKDKMNSIKKPRVSFLPEGMTNY